MPWVLNEQAGWHYVRKKEKRDRTTRIIIEPNPPKATDGQSPTVDVPGAVLGSEGADAGGNAGSDSRTGGDRLGPGVWPRLLQEARQGQRPSASSEEQRAAEGDTPAPRVRVAGDGLGRLRKGERY